VIPRRVPAALSAAFAAEPFLARPLFGLLAGLLLFSISVFGSSLAAMFFISSSRELYTASVRIALYPCRRADSSMSHGMLRIG